MKSIIISLLLIVGSVFASAQSTISYTFDKQGRVKSELVANNYKMLFNYDKEGNIVSKIVTTETDLEETKLGINGEYNIYPNPTTGDVTIETLTYKSELEITLYDISGKILEKKHSWERNKIFARKVRRRRLFSDNEIGEYNHKIQISKDIELIFFVIFSFGCDIL